MDHADSQHLSRLSKMLLAGTGLAFAWVLLSLALGLTATQAHADDDGGLLGGLTSTVEDTTAGVTNVVEDTAAAVVEPVAPIVQTVVEPAAPVVQQVTQTAPALPVAPVVEVVDTVVAPVTKVVSDVAEAGVVAPIVDSTVAVVDAVPVVGEVVSTLGVDTAASSLGSSVDGVLQGTTGAVTGTVDVVTDVVDTTTGVVTAPALPAVPPLIAPNPVLVDGGLVGAVTSSPTDAAVGPLEMLARAAYLTGATAWLALSSDLPAAFSASDSTAVSGGAAGIVFALLRSVMQADSVLVGPGGAGPGAWVLVALGLVVAHRAWVRRSGLENDVAPPAPVMSTDVSPD